MRQLLTPYALPLIPNVTFTLVAVNQKDMKIKFQKCMQSCKNVHPNVTDKPFIVSR